MLSVSLCGLGVCRLGFKTHLGKSEQKGRHFLRTLARFAVGCGSLMCHVLSIVKDARGRKRMQEVGRRIEVEESCYGR